MCLYPRTRLFFSEKRALHSYKKFRTYTAFRRFIVTWLKRYNSKHTSTYFCPLRTKLYQKKDIKKRHVSELDNSNLSKARARTQSGSSLSRASLPIPVDSNWQSCIRRRSTSDSLRIRDRAKEISHRRKKNILWRSYKKVIWITSLSKESLYSSFTFA